MPGRHTTAVIACGALAREIVALVRANALQHIRVVCVPATYHNRPQLIPGAVRAKIRECRSWAREIHVAFADCGTGGELDLVLSEENVSRISGPHCYAFYAGQERFEALNRAELGTFYLTDFLARQFDSLIKRGLGLDRHPELRDMYFGHYRKLIYLAQTDDEAISRLARRAADYLGLDFERQFTGYGELANFMATAGKGADDGSTGDRLLAGHSGPSHRQVRPQNGEAPVERSLRTGDRSRRHARQTDRDGSVSRPMAEIGS